MIDLKEYGWNQTILPNGTEGIPARITAVHRERKQLHKNLSKGIKNMKKNGEIQH